jgi:hypothetical protein
VNETKLLGVWLAGIGALSLALSACSNGSDDGTSDDDVTEEPDSTPGPGEPVTPAEPAAEPEGPVVEPEGAEPEGAEPEGPVAEPEATEPEGAEPDAPVLEPEDPAPESDASLPEPDMSSRPDGGEPPSEPLDGVCGQRGEGTVDAESFEGFEERYVIGEEGFGDDVCVVRFPVERVGEAAPGCVDLEGAPCAWAHEVEIGEGSVLTEEDGACASSDLALDMASIAAIAGTRVSYGFVDEYVGHNSVLLVFDEQSQSWLPSGNANWDEATGSFRFDRRDGICSY